MNKAEAVRVAGPGLLPLAIADWVRGTGRSRTVFIAPDDVALDALHAALPVFLPDHHVLALPQWDSLPYDRARPSRGVTGRRVASLSWLIDPQDRPAVVLTTPEALPMPCSVYPLPCG
jgi:transcription-repair coupling factor (superfamily II helicase)